MRSAVSAITGAVVTSGLASSVCRLFFARARRRSPFRRDGQPCAFPDVPAGTPRGRQAFSRLGPHAVSILAAQWAPSGRHPSPFGAAYGAPEPSHLQGNRYQQHDLGAAETGLAFFLAPRVGVPNGPAGAADRALARGWNAAPTGGHDDRAPRPFSAPFFAPAALVS
jgi:hypothetical protein